jgi:hypothetical protein
MMRKRKYRLAPELDEAGRRSELNRLVKHFHKKHIETTGYLFESYKVHYAIIISTENIGNGGDTR